MLFERKGVGRLREIQEQVPGWRSLLWFPVQSPSLPLRWLQERSGAGRPRDAAAAPAEAAAPRPRSGRCGTHSSAAGPLPAGSFQDAAGRRREALESLVVTAGRQTAPFFTSLSSAKNGTGTAAAPRWALTGGFARVPLADLLFFWHAVFTFLAVWLLVCVTLAVSSQQGFSVLPIFLYNCIAVSSSWGSCCNWRTVGVNKLLCVACLFSFYLQAKFLILQNKILLSTLAEPMSTLCRLIFKIFLVWPRVEIDLLLSTCVPSMKNACEMLCVCWNIHYINEDVNL